MKPVVLIVDDEKPTREVMARILERKYECLLAPDAAKAMEILGGRQDVALLITDYKMPGENGTELIRRAKEANPSLACILITAFGEIDLAVDAMKQGADDFLTKPVTDISQMEIRVQKAIEKHALKKKLAEYEDEEKDRKAFSSFTGRSREMEKVYKLVSQAARSNANVLVEGPSGTGKELVARALHDLSARSSGPFVAVECAALSPTLIESELFGHEKGAFTGADRQKTGRFEAASGGTLFLDEITEIDLSTQVKLLRVLETRTIQRVGGNADIPVDFRLVAATNRDLRKYVEEGKFREDLYYRLDVIEIKLPALKDRPGDVALLVMRFLKEFSKANGMENPGIDQQAMRLLENYSWPGNVRQLRNVVERMVVLSDGTRLSVGDVPPEIAEAGASAPVPPIALSAPLPAPAPALQHPAAPAQEHVTLAAAEKEKILATLAESGNNKTLAAERLGISRRTLHRKLNGWRDGK